MRSVDLSNLVTFENQSVPSGSTVNLEELILLIAPCLLCNIQSTRGLGQPSGALQGSLNGFPSSVIIVSTSLSSLNEFNSALRRNTELDVAVPNSLLAKH